MTFTNACNAGKGSNHTDTMNNAIALFGYENLVPLVPFSLTEIKQAYDSGDVHLNTLNMARWDAAAGFRFIRTDDDELMVMVASPLTRLYHLHGINAYSCSEGVSLLKHVALRMLKESEVTQ